MKGGVGIVGEPMTKGIMEVFEEDSVGIVSGNFHIARCFGYNIIALLSKDLNQEARGSYYNIPKAIFYLLKGNYKP